MDKARRNKLRNLRQKVAELELDPQKRKRQLRRVRDRLVRHYQGRGAA